MLTTTETVIREVLDRRLQILAAYRLQVERVAMNGSGRDSLAITDNFKRLDVMFADLLQKRPVHKGVLKHSESILHDLLSLVRKTTMPNQRQHDDLGPSDYDLLVSLFLALRG